MDIKKNLKKARKERKLTQDEVADSIGMTRQAYCNMERGKTDILNKKVYKLAEFYDMSVESLILGYSSVGDVKDLTEKLNNSVLEIEKLVALVNKMQETMYYQKEHIRVLKRIQDYIFGPDAEAVLKELVDSEDKLKAEG